MQTKSNIDSANWKPVPGFERTHAISTDGLIIKHHKFVSLSKLPNKISGSLIKPRIINKHPRVDLIAHGGRRKTITLWKLMMQVFRPELKLDRSVKPRFKDGNVFNCSLSNIEIVGIHSIDDMAMRELGSLLQMRKLYWLKIQKFAKMVVRSVRSPLQKSRTLATTRFLANRKCTPWAYPQAYYLKYQKEPMFIYGRSC